jgi:hypothetical protein
MNPTGKKSKMKLFLGVLLLAGPIGYLGAGDVPSNGEESQRNQAAVLKYLGPALKSRGGVARIDYVTACAAKDGTPLPFPAVKVEPSSKATSGLTAVREIFSSDKNVSVSESRFGVARVTIGRLIGSMILQTKIHSLALDQDEQYNAVPTIYAILGCKEVQAAMHQLGFEQPPTVMHAGIAQPEEGQPPLPRLPARITDLTVDQALDLIAKTFGGIVIYKECADANGKRLFSLDFTQAIDL